jgi:hypothetical protein
MVVDEAAEYTMSESLRAVRTPATSSATVSDEG